MNIKLFLLLPILLAGCDTSGIGVSKPATPGTHPIVSNNSGPALTTDPAVLAANLVCTGDLTSREPVLLVHGTAVSAAASYDWSYQPALTALAIPYCTVQLPENATADIQIAAEFVVYAIREMNRISGRKVQIIGHSQGGMLPRWALRFWPDTREKVDDLIGLAASNHGTLDTIPFCLPGRGCAAAIWQQASDAKFITALNQDFETYDNISYTSVYTTLDEIVIPNTPIESSTSLSGGTNVVNVATQEICPNNTADHLTLGTSDAVGYALALDALNNNGPADPARIALTTCLEPFHEGVNPATFAADFANVGVVIAQSLAAAPALPEEPPLKCYVDSSC